MKIHISCSCGRSYRVGSELAGSTVKCKACGEAIEVSFAIGDAVEESAAPPAGQVPRPPRARSEGAQRKTRTGTTSQERLAKRAKRKRQSSDGRARAGLTAALLVGCWIAFTVVRSGGRERERQVERDTALDLDHDAWRPYTSKLGCYTADFPGLPKHSPASKSEQAAEAVAFSQEAYTVTYYDTDLGGMGLSPERTYKQLEEEADRILGLSRGKLEGTPTRLEVDGQPTLELTFAFDEGGPCRARLRVSWRNTQRVYVAIYEAAQPSFSALNAERFLNSVGFDSTPLD